AEKKAEKQCDKASIIDGQGNVAASTTIAYVASSPGQAFAQSQSAVRRLSLALPLPSFSATP
ncbi:hypothetical protein MGG_17996, partial [Pyricularia oryzae 70-15]